MSARSVSRWVVVKFGGTSVSSLANWRNIALVVKRRQESGHRVLVVHSAISKVTDGLEKLLAAALAGKPDEPLMAIEDRHRQLTTELGLDVSAQLQGYFDDLRQMANGISLVRELSDRTRARVMANGELMATEIGARFLEAQGIDVTWMDAREMLTAEDRGASAKASVLSATCSFAPDAALEQRLDAASPVVITQGFIARDNDGNTCLLGRGGSDTSAVVPGRQDPRPGHRDLDRRARHVQRQSARHAVGAPDPRAALRRSAGNRDQRRQGAASALPAAGAAVPDTSICVRHPVAGPRRHADHRRVRARRAGEGHLQPQGHHADLARQSRHVAPGGIHGRRLRGVQGTRHVGRPGFDL